MLWGDGKDEDEEGSEEGSSEEEEEQGKQERGGQKRRRLAIPAQLQSLFSPENGRSSTLPAHSERKRRVPHVEGNYAACACLPVTPTAAWRRRAEACVEQLRRLVDPAEAEGSAKVHRIEEGAGLGWHVSLAPLLILRQQFISPLLGELQRAAIKAAGQPLAFDDDIWVLASASGDCYFAAAAVAEASAHRLRPLVAAVLQAAAQYGSLQGQPLARDARLHCSLAWTTANLRESMDKMGAEHHANAWGQAWRLPQSGIQQEQEGSPPRELLPSVPVPAMHVRVGERMHRFPLASATRLRGSVLGAYEDDDDNDEE